MIQNPTFRSLSESELELLKKNGNVLEHNDSLMISGELSISSIHNCSFFEQNYCIFSNNTRLESATFRNCTIAEGTIIENVTELHQAKIGANCIIKNTAEISFDSDSLLDFPNSLIAIRNENGGRSIRMFNGITPADAMIWTTFRDNKPVLNALHKIAEREAGEFKDLVINDNCTISNCGTIKNVIFAENTICQNCTEILNVIAAGTKQAPVRFGGGIIARFGIFGPGSCLDSNSIAINTITGENCSLTKGLRISDSFVSDNSHLSCCEIVSSFIYPFHEQHHNNSFLIAACIQGQSNIAAGATIGSNHNSRAADGELIAGRGFWPALCTNFKYNSVFSSFILVAKGNYQNELDIPFPFSLISLADETNQLQIMPAYWLMHNIYALERNEFKYSVRDKRLHRNQPIITEYLAPDTANEMYNALELLEIHLQHHKIQNGSSNAKAKKEGKSTLFSEEYEVPRIIETRPGLYENSKLPVRLLKIKQAFHIYLDFICLYICCNEGLSEPETIDNSSKPEKWHNAGGLIIADSELKKILLDLETGSISNAKTLHARYADLYIQYSQMKKLHAQRLYRVLCAKYSVCSDRDKIIKRATKTAQQIYIKAVAERNKDFNSKFRNSVYTNNEEQAAVLGTISTDPFLEHLKEKTEKQLLLLKKITY